MIARLALNRWPTGLKLAPVEITPTAWTIPSLVEAGHARKPNNRTSLSEALQRGRAAVSIRVPGLNPTLILISSFGFPPGSPGSLNVARLSNPEGEPGTLEEKV